ncbi:MAG: UV DNA damage repair endonuclease UvsE [candidate division WOR-3 bacterium]
MKIGYPCINLSVGCSPNKTFRLKNYSEENLKEKIKNNLTCLLKILEFNISNNIYFFRISSDIVPFASHPICKFNWQKFFESDFKLLGKILRDNKIRVSMHPDQFVLINSPDEKIVERSIKELEYHSDILELMETGYDAKIQIHVGGVYNDKEKSILRFIENYEKLPQRIKNRLVIENDDRSFSLKDCLVIYKKIKIPVVFDVFHHACLNNGESFYEGIKETIKTWKKIDGKLIVDYSSQGENKKRCSHSYDIDENDFKDFLLKTKGFDFDVMLEIKNKEKSVFKAQKILKEVSDGKY